MSKHTRQRYVYIKKLYDPLVIEHYEPTGPAQKLKARIRSEQWKIYCNYREAFLRLNGEMKIALIEEKFVPPALTERYEEAKQNFLTAQEIINREYENQVL
jgi:hypothetical protein